MYVFGNPVIIATITERALQSLITYVQCVAYCLRETVASVAIAKRREETHNSNKTKKHFVGKGVKRKIKLKKTLEL